MFWMKWGRPVAIKVNINSQNIINMKLKPSIIIGLLPALGMEAGTVAQTTPPNVVLILADDMGYSDIGCFGSEINTPNLDSLAKNGIRMTQFYNASRSCPTRASLLTGLYQHQAGVGDMVSDLGYPSYLGYLNTTCVTLAEAMKSVGYNTYMSGKWHVGGRNETLPVNRGFDRYFGLIDGAGSYFQRIPYRNNQKAPRMMLDSSDFEPPKDFYFTNAITDYALSFLDQETSKKEPFFLYLAYTAPHWPLHALPDDIKKYKGKYIMGWDKIRETRYKKMQKLGLIDATTKLTARDKNSPDWESLPDSTKAMWDLRMAVYAAMIDRLDQNIGRVIDKLKQMGELDNTLIIFLSDNGGCHEGTKNKGQYIRTTGLTGNPDSFDAYEYPWANVSNTPFRLFKHWVHEGGISTPFIACCPKMIKAGQISHSVGHIIDIMPTLLDLAGGMYPTQFKGNIVTPMQGMSLLPLFLTEKLLPERTLFWEHEGNRAVRNGNWKLVSQYDYGNKKFMEWELYYLKNDRSEQNNIFNQNMEKGNQLVQEYENWAKQVGVVSKEILDAGK